jgi:3-oxoacyl-[acyl-carrier-protein] synthase III
MRFEDVYIAGTGSWLPARTSTAEAIARGRCDPALARRNDIAAVAVGTEKDSPPEMAAAAARVALDRAGGHAGGRVDIDLVLHANLHYQGHELWGAASYVQRTAVGNRCPAMEVRQVSNGGMAALQLAAGYLAGAGRSAALVTAADMFPLPGFDRWHTDPGTVYADGGAAVVLSRAGGVARLRSLVLISDPDLEGMHRAGDAYGPAPMTYAEPLDLDTHARAFFAQVGSSAAVARIRAGHGEALRRALADAETELGEISRFVVPHFGRRRLEAIYLRQLGISLDQTTWQWSRQVGHLGAGDQFASLNHLLETGAVTTGDRCLLLGVGAGFSWSGAVVEILCSPRWDELGAAAG